MKSILTGLFIVILLTLPISEARSHRVHAHRRAGHVRHSYHRTRANNIRQDNYSHRGNYNPWSGKRGTRHH